MSQTNTTTQKIMKDKRSSMERLDAMENLLPKIAVALTEKIEEMDKKLSPLNRIQEILDAMISVIGLPAVEAALKENAIAAAKAQAEVDRADNEKLKADGFLVPEDVVTETSLLVLGEKDADGNDVAAGWFRVQMQNLKPESKELFLGKAVGATGVYPNGNQFQILESLRVDQEKVKQHAEVSNVETV